MVMSVHCESYQAWQLGGPRKASEPRACAANEMCWGLKMSSGSHPFLGDTAHIWGGPDLDSIGGALLFLDTNFFHSQH